mgnify:CR=1 FL=1|jgi:hypothetical protein|tara:strand:- start:345 stop:623 length:279 start_codon:yes stop_codon:yes gene_type:complete
MKFNPLTKEVFTDKGDFIKSLSCPFKINWELLELNNSSTRKCLNCESLIIDTKLFTDDEVHNMISLNPKICLKIDLNQSNIKVISDGILDKK